MRSILLLVLLLSVRTTQGQAPVWQDPPKVVIGVVVDQMRTDFLYRYWENYGEEGFKRLVREGAFCRNAHIPYFISDTGPGHASIHTGTTPDRHGIVANDRYDRRLRRTVYCVEDSNVRIVGGGKPGQGRSPIELQARTLADEMERASVGRARTVGISLKDRGAILPMGRTGDAAFWFSGDGFVSSTWYMEALPPWLVDFNARHSAREIMRGKWDLLLPRERYHSPLPDHNPYEVPIGGSRKAELPLELDSMQASRLTDPIIYTPWGNTLLTDLALAVMDEEGFGADDHTDLLSISYSATDKLCHAMGPLSLEMEDMYIRLDAEIARLLSGADERFGKGNYTLFLTSDHGGPDVAEYWKDRKGSAGHVEMKDLLIRLEKDLQATYGPGPWVLHLDDHDLYLDRDRARSIGVDLAELQGRAATVFRETPGILDVLSSTGMERWAFEDGVRALARKGYHTVRGADLRWITYPGFEPRTRADAIQGTDHGSGWTYDTHVPLIFFGKGILPTSVVRRVPITDIVPTVTMLLGCALPDAASGDPIPEVLSP